MASGENTALMRKRHGIILEDRKNLTLTGVKDVSGFDEQKVILQTELGELTIKGGNLHINDFSHENGELNLDGKVDSLVYTEDKRTEGGFFARLLK
ncbi:MAG: sporulation protein YabP [Acutalibacteraceae bacterium]|nr:sporulation protein YabP [Acutalibacteraceae bacterium]